MKPPHVITDRCLIRLALPGDLPALLAYWTANGSRYSPELPPSLNNEDYWMDRVVTAFKEFAERTACRMYVFERERGAVIGTVALMEWQRGLRHKCAIGYGVSRDNEGKGYMYESVGAAIQYAFVELNLHRIEATCDPQNIRSLKLLERLGFRRECEIPEYTWIDGSWKDVVLFGRINGAWRVP